MKRSLIFAVAASVLVAGGVGAQEVRAADSRLFPFVGCWRADGAAESGSQRDALSCVVPVAASADVELVEIIDGQVADRRRVDASGRPRAVDDEGCRGQEQASWSAVPRRVYLHSEFVCAPNGMVGGKTTLMSILPSGEWLEVESVRSGVGSIIRVERRRDAGVPSSVPRELAARLGRQRLAVMTARAEAASPLRTADVVEALHHTDSSVVRAWLVATAQHFQLTGEEVASLVRSEVPAPVLQAMMATAPAYQLGVGIDASGRSTDAYLSSPGVPGGSSPMPGGAAPQNVPYENVYVYGAQPAYSQPAYAPEYSQPMYSSYNSYDPLPGVPVYYPAYAAPYYSYYTPDVYSRFPRSYAPVGPVQHRLNRAPSYYSNPVGVRAGQQAASPPRQVPSRRRP